MEMTKVCVGVSINHGVGNGAHIAFLLFFGSLSLLSIVPFTILK